MHATAIDLYTVHHNGDFSGNLIISGPTGADIHLPFALAADVVSSQLAELLAESNRQLPKADSPAAALEALVADDRGALNALTRAGEHLPMSMVTSDGMLCLIYEAQTVPVSVLAWCVGAMLQGEMATVAEYDGSAVDGFSFADLEGVDPIDLLAHLCRVEPKALDALRHERSAGDQRWADRRQEISAAGNRIFSFSAGAAFRTVAVSDEERQSLRGDLELLLNAVNENALQAPRER